MGVRHVRHRALSMFEGKVRGWMSKRRREKLEGQLQESDHP